jgi:23S rRNA (cytidine1920-2'-O)/16S rRNA (cytidine1409-2'-O)-methyltransferase
MHIDYKNKVTYLCHMIEERLDKILIQRGLADNRGKAEKIIREIGVKVNGKLVTKNGRRFPTNCNIELIQEDVAYSSMGAAKLEEALKIWSPDILDKKILEIGCRDAFTEVLINQNAGRVYSIGLGVNQLDINISGHKNVIDRSDMLVREINSNSIPELLDGCVINEQTLSLSKILPFVHPTLKSGGFVIALIRVELEVDKQYVSKTGLVKKKKLFPQTIEEVKAVGITNNLVYQGHITSPIIGESGNQEFLMYFLKN